MNLYAPVSGTVLALESVPDPVFAGLMLGPGIAVQPEQSGTVTVVSPIAGKVSAARAHAVIIDFCLVHAGVDTFKSEALTCLTGVGASVDIGTPLIDMNMGQMGDLPSMIITSFPEYDLSTWKPAVEPGAYVTAGELLGTLSR